MSAGKSLSMEVLWRTHIEKLSDYLLPFGSVSKLEKIWFCTFE